MVKQSSSNKISRQEIWSVLQDTSMVIVFVTWVLLWTGACVDALSLKWLFWLALPLQFLSLVSFFICRRWTAGDSWRFLVGHGINMLALILWPLYMLPAEGGSVPENQAAPEVSSEQNQNAAMRLQSDTVNSREIGPVAADNLQNPSIGDLNGNGVPTKEKSGIGKRVNLEKLSEQIWSRRNELGRKNPLYYNCAGSAVEQDAVVIYLAINTPYWQEQFRRQISDSPFIRFEGPDKPEKITIQAEADSRKDSLYLLPDYTVYSTETETVTFTLYNENEHRVLTFGSQYIVARQAADGQWYRLPHLGIWNDMAYGLAKGKDTFRVAMNPVLNRNKPGIYRLYKKVSFSGEQRSFWLMAEFRLSADPQEVAKARKISLSQKQ